MLSIDSRSLEKLISSLRVWLTANFPCFFPIVLLYALLEHLLLLLTTQCQGYLVCMHTVDGIPARLSQLLGRSSAGFGSVQDMDGFGPEDLVFGRM